jgi:hypothetical protein
MAVEKYSIGGTVAETDASEAFADIPQNRVLMAEKLTTNTPVKPEIVEGLTTVEEVFGHFKPKVELDFENEEGGARKESLSFKNLSDFGVKGITEQSAFLKEQSMKSEQFQKIIKQLKTNKLLKQALSDPASKQSLISALQLMVAELEKNK